jgi:hypothetical protein
MLSAAQKSFFATFGYLKLPDFLADDIVWITDEFEASWLATKQAAKDTVHDGSKRTMHPELFVSTTPRLSTLVEHPGISAVCSDIMGEGWSLNGGDGNFYSGDTGWHSDVWHGHWQAKTTLLNLKIAFYLDPLTRDTGALRVIPGSHRFGDAYCDEVQKGLCGGDSFGLSGQEIPAVAIDIRPGDLVLFDHRLKHAAYGGGRRRRMFTMNYFATMDTVAKHEAAVEIMRYYYEHEHVRRMFRPEWIASAPPERVRHLLPALKVWSEAERAMQAVAV